MPGGLPDLSADPTAYAIVATLVAIDVLFPLIPGETAVLAAGILVADGDLSPWIVVAAAALGAFCGDNVAYWLARGAGGPVVERLERRPRTRVLVRWAVGMIERRRVQLILTSRFLPGGRTATSLAAGSTGLRWPLFLTPDALAAVMWATYTMLLGAFWGSALEGSLWKPLLASIAVAALVGLLAEVIRRRRTGHGADPTSGAGP